MGFLRGARSATAFLLVMLWMGVVGGLWMTALRASVLVSPRRRFAWVSTWAQTMSINVLTILRFGGARFERSGLIRTDEPGVIVMNHQSVLDIPTIAVMCTPEIPIYIARRRYMAAPLIGTGLRLMECPIVDPRQDREAAVETVRCAARLDRTLLIYPEGHRSPDGTVQPFKTAGLTALLGARRLPVTLVATQGFAASRRLLDFVFRAHEIQGRTEVVGRFLPPEDPDALPAFLEELQVTLATRVAAMGGYARGREPGPDARSPEPRVPT